MNTSDSPGLPPVALIAGPTASGKSALALRLARACDGVIVNADASQMYRDLRILSARPSSEEEAQVPHRLFGYVDGGDACSAPRWAEDAKAAIDAVHAEGRVPILVGGTGLYLRTLLDGIAPVPEIDPAVRAPVRDMPVADAFAALSREDPGAAARLRASDTTRVARALEVVRATGRTLADWHGERTGGIATKVRLSPLILLPPRRMLYGDCDARFLAMLDRGAEQEVARLAERGLAPELPVMRAIGVREILAFQRGQIDRATMIARAQAATRQYAKRQCTWFSHQPPDSWPHASSHLSDNQVAEMVTLLRSWRLT